MPRRVLTVLALAAASQGCNSYTVMGAGAAGLIAGGVILADPTPDERCQAYDIICGEAAVVSTTFNVALGLAIMAMSGALVIGGAAGATYDAATDKPTLAVASPATAALSLEGKTAATTALALQIRVAARANRCPAAYVMANKLAGIDPALVIAMIKRDDFVARCISEPGEPGEPSEPSAVAPGAADPR